MNVVVVGDVLLDIDLDGTADRLTPDAPVPVVDVHTTSVRAGGAGLVARMLQRDGLQVTLVTALSDDARARELVGVLDGVAVVAGRSGAPTPVKSRLRANGHALARMDDNCSPPPPPEVTDEMIAAVSTADVIVVADYGRGLAAADRLRDALRERASGVPLVWDPHPRGAVPVNSATIVTPNHAEASAAAGVVGSGVAVSGVVGLGVVVSGVDAAARAAAILGESWGCSAVVVTMGSHGALIGMAGGELPVVVPAPSVTVTDPCGAGDRFAASVAVALGSGASVLDAVRAGVADAAAFLAAGGVASLRLPANTSRLSGEASSALEVVSRIRSSGGTVVATGGCFDLVHAGHVRTLSAARELGDCLVVCLNSDASVRRLKGEERPIVSQQDRVDLLLALECVDAVFVFDEDTPESVIRRLEPDLWVKGGDYTADALPEAAVLAEWGGRAVTVPFHPGRSTSRLAGALARVG